MSIQKEDKIITNIHTSNKRNPKYMVRKPSELMRETDNSNIIFHIILRDFNTLLIITERKTRQKTSEELEDLNNTIN